MAVETIPTCPLGNECETVKAGKIHRCRWYMNVRGKDPQSEDIIDRWDCALVWQVVAAIENTQNVRGMTAATESFRNEMVNGQQQFNSLLATAMTQRSQLE